MTAIIFMTGLFWLASCTPYPWIVLAIAFAYYIPALPMGIVRQAAAVGITYVLVANSDRLALPARVLLAVAAMAFHSSAIVIVGLVFASIR